jgi:iron complex outermembrane receptor protein
MKALSQALGAGKGGQPSGWRVAGAALLVSVSPLAAQAAWAAPAAPPEPAGEIVVTATKRSENLQSVPISITALTGDALKQAQVASFDDYAKLVPSLSFQSFGPGQSQMNMRGISTGGDGLASGPLPTVGLYFDETPLTTIGSSVDVHVYDMARVEALSGPQGTLYGASSLSGTVRLIPNKPVIGTWQAGVDARGTTFGGGGSGGALEGFVNIPIDPHMALRISGFYQRDGGFISNTPGTRTYARTHDDGTGNYVDTPLTINNARYAKNDFNTVESAGGRAALRIDLDDRWTATQGVIYQNQVTHGAFLYDPRVGDLQVHDFTPDHSRDDWFLASLTLQGKISDWDMTYSGSYFERRTDVVVDYSYFTVAYDNIAKADPADYAGYTYLKDSLGHAIDPTQVVHTHDSYSKASQELRFSSPSSKPLRLTAGVFWQRQTNRHIADYTLPGLNTAVADPSALDFPPGQVAGAPKDDVYYTHLNRVDRDYAAFAEATYDVTSKLSVTAGIRGFIADNTLFGFSGAPNAVTRSALANGCTVVTVTGCPNVSKRYYEQGETHKLTANWKVMPGKLAYFTYSTGFRPGGNNRDSISPFGKVQSLPAFKSDKLTNYELGFKTSWFDRKLYLNGALFWEDWSNIQYSLPGVLGIFYTLNAGNARSRGVEAQVVAKPAAGWTLSGNATYLDAHLTTAFVGSDGTVQAPAGTPLPVTPQFKYNATARYDFSSGGYDLYFQAGLNHQGGTTSYLTTAGENALGATAGFTTTDFSAGFTKDRWSVGAFVTNAFDARGVLSKNLSCAPNLCGTFARYYPTKPQQFGVKTGYKF